MLMLIASSALHPVSGGLFVVTAFLLFSKLSSNLQLPFAHSKKCLHPVSGGKAVCEIFQFPLDGLFNSILSSLSTKHHPCCREEVGAKGDMD